MGSLSPVQRFKRRLVVQLVARNGEFWEFVGDIRGRCGITPITQLPPPDLLDRLADRSDASHPKHLRKLVWEITSRYRQIVPEEYGAERIPGWDWFDFLLACVLYDPPDTQLLQFAAHADPPHDPAPIRFLPDEPKRLLSAERMLWMSTIDEIERHYLKPSSPIGMSLLSDVWEKSPNICKEHDAALEQIPYRYYIEVNEDTTQADILNAFHVVAATLKKWCREAAKGGPPPRDPLVALQCAILHDCHNGRDPQDRRRWKWTYEKLAEEFGLPSARSAKAHVQKGREYLQDKP